MVIEQEKNFVRMEDPGHPKYILDLDGYLYRSKKSLDDKTYLICFMKTKENCKGTAHIVANNLSKKRNHTCQKQPEEVSFIDSYNSC